MCEQQLLPTLSKSHVCATTGQRLQQCCRRSSSRSSKRASGATLFPAALQAQVRGVAPGEDRRLSQQLRCCARACMLYALLNRHAFIHSWSPVACQSACQFPGPWHPHGGSIRHWMGATLPRTATDYRRIGHTPGLLCRAIAHTKSRLRKF